MRLVRRISGGCEMPTITHPVIVRYDKEVFGGIAGGHLINAVFCWTEAR